MGKAKLVLSVAMHPDKVHDSVIAELMTLGTPANVRPMTSVLRGGIAAGTRTRAESGIEIELLDVRLTMYVLYLWKRLRDVLKINCLWLEVWKDADNQIEPYIGCICEWPYYQEHYAIVAPTLIQGTP